MATFEPHEVRSKANVNVSGNNNSVLVGQSCTVVNFHRVPSTDETSDDSAQASLQQPSHVEPHISSEQLGIMQRTSQVDRGQAGRIMKLIDSVRGMEKIVDKQKIFKSVQDAYCIEIDPSLRVNEPSNVLCLDCSRQMTPEGFQHMKKLAHDFVDEVEDRAAQEEKEQNIAVVCVSNGAKVVQHLTIDFSKVRDAINDLSHFGSSTYCEAIAVSLAALDNRKIVDTQGPGEGQDSPEDEYRNCRLIFITRGEPSVENCGHTDDTMDDAIPQMTLIRLIKSLGESKILNDPQQIVWVPVAGSDVKFLDQISKYGGVFHKDEDIKKLAAFFD